MLGKNLISLALIGARLFQADAVSSDENQTPCPGNGYVCTGKPFGNVYISDLEKYHPAVHWRCVDPGMVAMTFDDGPNTNTEKILNILRDLGVKATFFVNGQEVNPSTSAFLTRAENEGHDVGSHTYSHASMSGQTPESIESFLVAEVDKNAKTCRQYLPKRGLLKMIRPPYLDMDELMADALAARGYKVIQISVDTNDWKPEATLSSILASYDSMMDTAIGLEMNSYISLEHANSPTGISAIAPLVNKVRALGYRLVTMTECLTPVAATPPTTPTVPPTRSPTVPPTAAPTTKAPTTATPTDQTTAPTIPGTSAPPTAAPPTNPPTSAPSTAAPTAGTTNAQTNAPAADSEVTYAPTIPIVSPTALPTARVEACSGDPCNSKDECRSSVSRACSASNCQGSVPVIWSAECDITSGAGAQSLNVAVGAVMVLVALTPFAL